jgi:hypothetical protein
LSDLDVFDTETVNVLRDALERAWDILPAVRRRIGMKDHIARALIAAAKAGERDPERLLDLAIKAGLNG